MVTKPTAIQKRSWEDKLAHVLYSGLIGETISNHNSNSYKDILLVKYKTPIEDYMKLVKDICIIEKKKITTSDYLAIDMHLPILFFDSAIRQAVKLYSFKAVIEYAMKQPTDNLIYGKNTILFDTFICSHDIFEHQNSFMDYIYYYLSNMLSTGYDTRTDDDLIINAMPFIAYMDDYITLFQTDRHSTNKVLISTPMFLMQDSSAITNYHLYVKKTIIGIAGKKFYDKICIQSNYTFKDIVKNVKLANAMNIAFPRTQVSFRTHIGS